MESVFVFPNFCYCNPLFSDDFETLCFKKIYDFSLYDEEKDYYVLLLTPRKRTKAMLREYPLEDFKFHLWISKKTFQPVKSVFITENIVTLTDLKDYNTEADIPDEDFEFKIPEGSEVLRLFK